MQPMRALWQLTADLLAADTGTLAAATAMHAHLIAAPFDPSIDLDLGDLTFATFTGSAAKALGTGTQPVFVDASTGLRTIVLKEPAGGLVWECTADPVAPETIYGVAVTDTADAVLHAVLPFVNPVTIDAADQAVLSPPLTLAFSESYPN